MSRMVHAFDYALASQAERVARACASNDRRVCAIHECAHAIAALRFGFRVRRLEIEQMLFRRRPPPTSLDDPELDQGLIVSLAGPAACHAYYGVPVIDNGASDVQKCEEALARFIDDRVLVLARLKTVIAEALRLVIELRPAIEAVAWMLRQKSELSGEELNRILTSCGYGELASKLHSKRFGYEMPAPRKVRRPNPR